MKSSKKTFSYSTMQQAYKAKDAKALEKLYMPCHEDLMLYCLGKFKSMELAEEAASETLKELLEHPNPEDIPNLKAWLFTVAKNACLQVISTEKRRAGILSGLSTWFNSSERADGEEKMAEESLHNACKAVLNHKDYQIFLAEQQGYKDHEIAEQLHMNAKTVANRKSLIKKKLKEKFRNII